MNQNIETVPVKEGKLIRYIQAFVFVAIYITLGLVFKLGPNHYLIMGIPLMLLFQVFVSKRPIHTMWVRDDVKFHLNKWGILMAVMMSIYPAKEMITGILNTGWNFKTLVYFVIILGSIAAAYSLTRFTKKMIPQLLLCLATAGSLGIVLFVSAAVARSINQHQPMHVDILEFFKSMLTMFPFSFMVEEVVFRGVIDSHVHRTNEPKGILSAAFVSALWGLWHIPVALPNADGHIIPAVIFLVVVHTAIGIPLSIFWRRTGNLVVPAFTHILIDSIRNALMSLS